MGAAHVLMSGTAGPCAVGCYARSIRILVLADRGCTCTVLRSLWSNELDETAEAELSKAWGDRDGKLHFKQKRPRSQRRPPPRQQSQSAS